MKIENVRRKKVFHVNKKIIITNMIIIMFEPIIFYAVMIVTAQKTNES